MHRLRSDLDTARLLRGALPDLEPDRRKMAKVTALMNEGMRPRQAPEAIFAVATLLWVLLAALAFFARDVWLNWLGTHPVGTLVLVILGVSCLAVPVVILAAPREGGLETPEVES